MAGSQLELGYPVILGIGVGGYNPIGFDVDLTPDVMPVNIAGYQVLAVWSTSSGTLIEVTPGEYGTVLTQKITVAGNHTTGSDFWPTDLMWNDGVIDSSTIVDGGSWVRTYNASVGTTTWTYTGNSIEDLGYDVLTKYFVEVDTKIFAVYQNDNLLGAS